MASLALSLSVSLCGRGCCCCLLSVVAIMCASCCCCRLSPVACHAHPFVVSAPRLALVFISAALIALLQAHCRRLQLPAPAPSCLLPPPPACLSPPFAAISQRNFACAPLCCRTCHVLACSKLDFICFSPDSQLASPFSHFHIFHSHIFHSHIFTFSPFALYYK